MFMFFSQKKMFPKLEQIKYDQADQSKGVDLQI